MHKKVLVFLIIMVVLSFLGGCEILKYKNEKTSDPIPSADKSYDNEPEAPAQPTEPSDNQGTAEQQTHPSEDKIDPIKKQLDQMTIDEKIGQMLIVGFEGYSADKQIQELIEKYHVGGVIFFKNDYKGYKGNIQNTDQLLNLVNAIKSVNGENKIPLFISTDEEGGRVSRMPDELAKLPTSQVVGQVNRPDFSYAIGNIIAEELNTFGFNMDFAPVLDINSNPKNPVIGDRSFGANAEVVSDLGIQTMKGIQSKGIISVVKHFPGHGDTSVDSHEGLPLVNNDLNRLDRFELIPFEEAVKNKVDAIMVAHILLPKIDPENPASMSKTIISDILRDKLQFIGVVLTDDMTMGAILKKYDIGDAAVQSINAGADIVLVCHGYDHELAVIQAIEKAVADGRISEERIEDSVYRILSLKQKYGLSDNKISIMDVEAINSRIHSILKQYVKQK